MASKCMAYFLWMIGGYFGLHHFYLKRDKQAFIWWCLPGGYFGAGWIRDFWRIPEYVADANNDQEYVKKLTDKMRASDTPPSKMARWLGMLGTCIVKTSTNIALALFSLFQLSEILLVC